MDRCQGVENQITPHIIDLECPACGAELEMFSNELQVECACGQVIKNAENAALSVG